MEPFIGSLYVGMFLEDNTFYRIRYFDQWNIEDVPFSVENIRRLQKEWQEAQKIQEEHSKAIKMVEMDPTCYARFMEVWKSCMRRRARVRVQAN
jgi:hypothetical protein